MNLNKIATSFSRGLNMAASHTINDLECQVAENFVFKDRSATVRKGYQLHAQVCSGPVVAIEKFYQQDGDAFFTAVGDGTLFYSTVSGQFDSISSLPINGAPQTTAYDGALYITDFDNPPQYFNGAQTGVVGLSSPIFRKQLDDCEDVSRWTVQTSGGEALEDTNYMHRERGSKSITFRAKNATDLALFQIGGAANLQGVNSITGTEQNDNEVECYTVCRNASGILRTENTVYTGVIGKASNNSGQSWNNEPYLETRLNWRGLPEQLPIAPVFDYPYSIGNTNRFMLTDRSGLASVVYRNYYSGDIRIAVCSSPGAFDGTSGTALFANVSTSSVGVFMVDDKNEVYQPYWMPRAVLDMSGFIHVGFHPTSLGYPSDTSGRMQYSKYDPITQVFSDTSAHIRSPLSPYGSPYDMDVDTSGKLCLVYASAYNQSSHTSGQIILRMEGVPDISVTSGSIASGAYPCNPVIHVDCTSNVIHVAYREKTNTGAGIAYRKWIRGSGYFSTKQVLVSGKNTTFTELPLFPIGIQKEVDSDRTYVVFAGKDSADTTKYTAKYVTMWSGYTQAGIVDTNQTIYYNQSSLYPAAYPQAHLLNKKFPVLSSSYVAMPRRGFALFARQANSPYEFQYYEPNFTRWGSAPTNTPAFDLTEFAGNVSSEMADYIQLYAIPNNRANISNFLLRFIDNDGNIAVANLASTSAWMSTSTNEFGIKIAVPKSNFSAHTGSLTWGSCDMQIGITATNAANYAQVAVDNIRMLKTPPIIASQLITSARFNTMFWGQFAKRTTERSERWIANPNAKPNRLGYYVDPSGIGRIWTPFVSQTSSWTKLEFDSVTMQGIKRVGDPLPTGTYFYKCTFVKESPNGYELESNPTLQTSGWIVSHGISSWTYLNITNVPQAPDEFGVAGRRIYRRRSDETEFRYVYSIHDNTETSFFDNVPQAALGWILEDDHNPPPKAKFIFRASNQRMYYYNVEINGERHASRVYASKEYAPYYCPEENGMDVSPDDGTEGTGVFELAGIVHLLKERSTWRYDQNGLGMVSPNVGCVAPGSVASDKNDVFWLSDLGPVRYNGRVNLINHSLDGQSRYRIEPILKRLPAAYLKNAKGVVYDGYYLLSVTDQGSTTNNLVLCYDIDNDVWSVFTNIEACSWSVWNGYKDGYRLFFGNYSGQIMEMFAGDTDNGTPIHSEIRSKDFGVPSPEEFFRKAYLFTENVDDSVKTLTVQPYYDFTQTSSDADVREISGQYNLQKIAMPQTDSASYFGLGVSTSGRYRINVAELYVKTEGLR